MDVRREKARHRLYIGYWKAKLRLLEIHRKRFLDLQEQPGELPADVTPQEVADDFSYKKQKDHYGGQLDLHMRELARLLDAEASEQTPAG